MNDKIFYPLAAFAAIVIIAFSLIWPQGLGTKSPAPFGHAILMPDWYRMDHERSERLAKQASDRAAKAVSDASASSEDASSSSAEAHSQAVSQAQTSSSGHAGAAKTAKSAKP